MCKHLDIVINVRCVREDFLMPTYNHWNLSGIL